ncbi:hypothetical protein N7533_012854 [Penicillium manginii]|jgi:hypothetical protein|uniref:uncharacterized protein n=1 Tax=Penicillium manginii TaxID=203109 RepID=UPI0025494229|nr:uncharacterized protein N7533_012854 [Penicillium manginii]KAJ5740070.1 hypothetical protein N7533_012854 [Penicillium manginii]
MNTDGPYDKDQTTESTNDECPREDIAASSRFMPQSGKPAGIYNTQTESVEREETPHDERRGEEVAASHRFMPQAGKPTGTSSL